MDFEQIESRLQHYIGSLLNHHQSQRDDDMARIGEMFAEIKRGQNILAKAFLEISKEHDMGALLDAVNAVGTDLAATSTVSAKLATDVTNAASDLAAMGDVPAAITALGAIKTTLEGINTNLGMVDAALTSALPKTA